MATYPHTASWHPFVSALILMFLMCGCGGQAAPSTSVVAAASVSGPVNQSALLDPLTTYSLAGDTSPVRDPSIIRQGSVYYLFSTDTAGPEASGSLPIRCSPNKENWAKCGYVFSEIPQWVRNKIPGVGGLWAPDISYFGGAYHLYYSASLLNSQTSVIGLATNVTLDPADPRYRWVDAGEVIESGAGDDFNAIDPNVLIADDGGAWLNYGSYWSGIKQVQLQPATGQVLAGSVRYDLAARPDVLYHPIEGASIVKHGVYYFLFVSIDQCCNQDSSTDDYKEAVGRSMNPHGPFTDANGIPMMSGGGKILLAGNGTWNAPGAATAFIDGTTGESLLVFQALKMSENAASYAWIKKIEWQNDWPVLAE